MVVLVEVGALVGGGATALLWEVDVELEEDEKSDEVKARRFKKVSRSLS